MILKSKFFSILDSGIEGSLTRMARYGSSPDIAPDIVNIKGSITIREVGLQDALSLVNRIRANMINGNWCIKPNQTTPLDKDQVQWYSRCYSTYKLLCQINDILYSGFEDISDAREHYFFVMFYEETPIGILVFSNDATKITEPAKIEEFAIHVGMRRSGVFLMEYAVNKSKELGKNGNVKLIPARDAISVYFKYGFEFKGGYMVLEPSQNHKWGIFKDGYYFKAGCAY
ncbi:GNAT family N-acetyltransferase [Xenorhabdus sp. Reich]|uniref:GNAT family N-acetyltransferase n=1 Tax=Xenorhabdus littoralis TaxID=2582835 RepID=A0ABU4SIZ2_9GAMM|nr:GNAT family N-acetyltransferase [Xenorhabdus sp. Reich]MDX7998554.1 GNAT family N-acetyltransferase [Xenorhabdus sp. Reich]